MSPLAGIGKNPAGRWSLTHQVYFLASLLMVLATASLLYVGHIASRAADKQAVQNEMRLIESALHDRQRLMARDQMTLARWDRAVANIPVKFNPAFVRYELLDSLWYDFGHERTFLVDPQGALLAESHREVSRIGRKSLPASSVLLAVSRMSVRKYEGLRSTSEAGPGRSGPPAIDDMATFAYVLLDKTPTFISAMPIVPDDGAVTPPPGPPVILMSARLIDERFTADINSRLAFRDMKFMPGETPPAGSTSWPITSPDGEIIGHFQWTSETPGEHVWRMILPTILLLWAMLAGSAFAVSRKVGTLTRSLEQREQEFAYLADHDQLTGLANRRQISSILVNAISGLPDKPFALIGCDLDRFKQINDTYGHAAGDEVLATVARRIEAEVGSAGVAGRMGGDEFVIVVIEFADIDRLADLGRRIMAALDEEIPMPNGIHAELGVSLGIAIAPIDGSTDEALLAAADAALYAAKSARDGTLVFAASLPRGEGPMPEKEAVTGTIPAAVPARSPLAISDGGTVIKQVPKGCGH
ncbi:diguanylate cyclase domain-containing protein [Pannonibacter indicus]|uniref:Diguanylate cyclase (GGDEF) domain n=1 Tax=Pannonibacter indicus TaxID=466044 RepID=A0A0K6HZC6_9HYPH|nr:diguanylate cyclase [Pannonibacter indicus]CUA96269.1 diguanylate cyclase (GGDEF) domain [Pannonibacter indicus]